MTAGVTTSNGRVDFLHDVLPCLAVGFFIVAIMSMDEPTLMAQNVAQNAAGGQTLAERAAAGTSPEDAKASEEQVKQKIAQRRQFYFDSLMQELDSMVPGEFEEGSKQKAELERAVEAFLDRDIATLNEILDQQATFDPDFPPRHLMLASMSYRVRDPQQGRRLLEKAAVASPRYPGTYAAFARLALNEGRITDAMALLDKCARLVNERNVSEKVKDHFGRQYVAGMLQVAIAQERYPAARDLLKRQMELAPDNAKNFLTGAEIEFNAGDLAKSQSYLEKLKEIVPEARPFESVFATWFRQQGKNDEAGQWVTAAAKKYPEDSVSQMDYVNWLMGQGELDAVRSALGKVEALAGETTATLFVRGQLAFADLKMEDAEALFEKVVQQTNGRNLEAANLYALALAESADADKHKQALQIAQQTLGRAPRNTVAQSSLAYILLRQGVLDQGQRLLLPVVRGKRVTSEVAYFFGYMLNKLDKKDGARQALQSALENKELFLYRKKCQQLLNQLGGPVSGDLPAPSATGAPATP